MSDKMSRKHEFDNVLVLVYNTHISTVSKVRPKRDAVWLTEDHLHFTSSASELAGWLAGADLR